MNIQTGGKVSGVYGIKVLRNAGTDKEHLEDFGESPNMLLDGFFDRFAKGNLGSSTWYMFVGSGTTPVEATQTQLVSQVGNYDSLTASANDNVKSGNDYIASSTGTAEWAIGAIVGNISEVGVKLGTIIGSTVDSRALIVDSQGDPTTITVTSEDKLEISYTLKAIIPIEQVVSVHDFAGVQTTCTVERLAVLDKGRNDLYSMFDIADRLSASTSNTLINNPESNSSSSNETIDGSNLSVKRTNLGLGAKRITFVISSSTGNLSGGIGGIGIRQSHFSNYHSIARFDPKIPKDSTKTLTLNFDFTLSRA
ncbi:hypothetical protein EI165_00300 [Pseudoalteromonas nigrifaciens]|uniref:hypothetical protein n=1 Tax=Pseudoalteromonas nigrifaciens TaxID=28109 RepID=UPI001788030A|nr:hypothetical protein [Pseudoalteromonas nigrifaciens]MBE0418560.1 hypothetical protein [Pseudoalteromonas nigrifaciens]